MIGRDQKTTGEPFISQVHEFFEEIIFGFILHDIDAAIKGKANYLAALGLVAYTEFMGGLVTGKSEKTKDREVRFYSFLSRMGKEYEKVQKPAWERVRHGLVHGYFIKQDSIVKMTVGDGHGEKCGIEVGENEGELWFIVTRYFEDFKRAVQNYYEQLVKERKTSLLQNFCKAVGDKWYFKRGN